MKVAINSCYGGFSLSNTAVKRLAELQGRECFFFTCDAKDRHFTEVPVTNDSFLTHAFDIKDPNAAKREDPTNYWKDHVIESRPAKRNDTLLIQVIEELGEAANGRSAKLKIIEIPDDVEFEIEEYDGNEWVSEKHRTWS